MPWCHEPNFYAVKFEDLVGSKGGGLDQHQHRVIEEIMRHLDLKLSDDTILKIQAELFNPEEVTFHKGQIGTWKQRFKAEHIAQIKLIVGTLLIELGYEKDLNW